MSAENKSHAFRLKNIDKTKNYLTQEINQNDLMSKTYGKFLLFFGIILNTYLF